MMYFNFKVIITGECIVRGVSSIMNSKKMETFIES